MSPLPSRSVAHRAVRQLEEVPRFFGMSFFQPKERRTDTLSVRITPALKRELAALARLWSAASQAHSGDDELEVTENDAAFRLLAASAPTAIAEMLGPNTKLPESEAEWTAVEKAIRARFSPARK